MSEETTAITSEEKAQVLVTHVASKASVPDRDLPTLSVPLDATATLAPISIKVYEIKKIDHLDANNAMDWDQISSRRP